MIWIERPIKVRNREKPISISSKIVFSDNISSPVISKVIASPNNTFIALSELLIFFIGLLRY